MEEERPDEHGEEEPAGEDCSTEEGTVDDRVLEQVNDSFLESGVEIEVGHAPCNTQGTGDLGEVVELRREQVLRRIRCGEPSQENGEVLIELLVLFALQPHIVCVVDGGELVTGVGCGEWLSHVIPAFGLGVSVDAGVHDGRLERVERGGVGAVLIASHEPNLGSGVPVGTEGLHGVAVLKRRTLQIEARGLGDSGGVRLSLQRSSASRISLERHFRIDLGVEVQERLLGRGAETRTRSGHRLDPVVEDAEVVHDHAQTASRDDRIRTTLHVGLADHFGPLDQAIGERLVHTGQGFHVADDDLLLHRLGGVVLLVGARETLKERLVKDAAAGELLRTLTTLTLGVHGGEDVEPGSRLDLRVDLRQERTLAFEDAHEAHDLVARRVHFVEQEDRATLHRGHDRTVLPHGVTVDEAEPTEQVVRVGLAGDVDTDALASELRADLFDHGRLAVAGETRHHGRIPPLGLHDGLHILVVAVRHIGHQLRRDEVPVKRGLGARDASLHRRSSRSRDSDRSGDGRSRDGRSSSDAGASSPRSVQLLAGVLAVTDAARVVLHQPRGHRAAVLGAERLDLRTRERRLVALGHAKIDEGSDLIGVSHECESPKEK